jgi:SAM-dependent methyltransferase
MANPKHVAIVALGPSSVGFLRAAEVAGGTKSYCDECWGINMVGGVIQCDRIFHMDDLKIQEMRVAYGSPIAEKLKGQLEWMRETEVPIYTSRAYPDYPSSVDYPLEEVIRSCGVAYFNNTSIYAICYAIHLGVKKLSLWGFDFTYPDANAAEAGRGCCEFWLGRAMKAGIEIVIPPDSTLMDMSSKPHEKFYGYDTLDLSVDVRDGDVKVTKTPRHTPRCVEELERSYNHMKWAVRSKYDCRGNEALDRLLEYDDVKTVLDIGSGDGAQAEIMREAGKDVTTLSYKEPADLVGDFMEMMVPADGGYDAIWASHVLEHQLDVNAFLRKCYQLLRDDGVLVITVPPAKNAIVGGHVTLWNSGLLVYNLIMAGFDCSEARVSDLYANVASAPPYNISVIVRKKPAELPALERDAGDIEKLRHLFPVPVYHGFDGNLPPVRW